MKTGDVLTDNTGRLFKIKEPPHYDTMLSISGTVECIKTKQKYKFNPKGYVYLLETYLVPYTGGKVLNFERHKHNFSTVAGETNDSDGVS